MKLGLNISGLTLICIILIQVIHISRGAFKDEQYLDSISCSSRHKINLLPNKTLIIKLSRWGDYHRGLSFLNFQCKFQVVAPRGYAVMAIIQNLHLRAKNLQSTSCRDYVKFENSDGLEAGPICGEILEGDKSENPKTLIGSRFFYDPKGMLDVAFKFDDTQIAEIQKPFQLELSFTAYSECTSTALLTRQVRQCSNSRPYSCISENLFCDGVINCGFRGDFGSDEDTCNNGVSTNNIPPNTHQLNHEGPIHRIDIARANNKEIPSSFAKSKEEKDEKDHIGDVHLGVPVQIFALVSAISGALVVLLVFLVCCCIVRNLSKRNLIQRQSESQRTIEISLNHTSVPMSRHVRSEVQNQAMKPPEDLPPSYEAIFPEPVPHKR